jgi:hypothetical protein
MLEQRVVTFSKSLAAQLVFPMETSRVQIFSPLTIELSKNKVITHGKRKKKKKKLAPPVIIIQIYYSLENKVHVRIELTYRVFNWTQRVGVVKTFISVDLLSSGSLGSNNSFFTKAFIPTSFLYRVRIGTGGIKSSLLATWPKSHFRANIDIKKL